MMWREWLFCLLLLWTSLANAAEIRLSAEDAFVPLADKVEVFEDKGMLMDIHEVLDRGQFSRPSGPPRPTFSTAAVWLKLEFFNASAVPLNRWLLLLSVPSSDVDFFVRQGDLWQMAGAGSHSASLRQPAIGMNPVLPFEIASAGRQVIYIRIASKLPIMVNPVVWEPVAFRNMENQVRLIDGLILGGLAVMVLAGVLLVFMFRERAFVFNTLATITYFLGEATAKGYSALYLWPEATDWGIQCLPLFALIGVGLNILLVRDLLATPRQFPKADRLLLTLLALQWLPAIGILFGEVPVWAKVSFALNFPITVALLLLGAYAISKRIRAARYYTAAYAVLTLGSLLHAMAQSGMVIYRWWGGEYALPLAMLLSNALLMASVVGRVMQARKEKAAAQEALLAVRASHEALLTQEVQARTAQLEEANVRLRGHQMFVQSVLDSVGSQIAVLDARGTIIAVNDAWQQFSLEDIEGARPLPSNIGLGNNYLETCRGYTYSRQEDRPEIVEGIQAVIAGRLPVFSLEYDCSTALGQRWFILTVTPLVSAEKGAVVVHTDITERKRLENEIHHLAFYDPLTNLVNRRLLQDRLQQVAAASLRSGNFYALLVLDLDDFKPLNDTHGHGVGDLLLIEVAHRLTACVRATDTVARLGGDEFVVVIGELGPDRIESLHQAENIAAKILAQLSETYVLTVRQERNRERTVEHRCSTSIGGTLFMGCPTDGEILNVADAAMYRAKEAGGNCVQFIDAIKEKMV